MFAEYQKLDAIILGVSGDDLETHKAFASAHQIPFPLLVDPDKTLVALYRVDTRFGYPHRTTFLVGPDGRLARVYTEVDPGEHAQQVLGDIRTLLRK